MRKAPFIATLLILVAAGLTTAPAAQAATYTTADCTIFAVADTLTLGTSGDDVVCGTEGNDLIKTGLGSDTIFGLGGSDELYGEGGNDIIYGANGDDLIYGGDGDDVIQGGSGNDRVYGQTGNDTISLGDFADFADAGQGNDEVYGEEGGDVIRANSGDDYVDGGIGNDDIDLGDGDDYGYGSEGDDRIAGGLGADALRGNDGNDGLDGGKGDDVLTGGAGVNYCTPDPLDDLTGCKAEQPAPSLVSVTMTPESLNTAGESKVVTVNVRLKDQAAGTKSLTVKVQRILTGGVGLPEFKGTWQAGPNSYCLSREAAEPTAQTPSTSCFTSGTANAGTVQFKFRLAPYTAKGTYRFSWLEAVDTAEKKTTLTVNALKTANQSPTFDQVGAGDVTKPELESLAISPTQIDTSSTGARVRVTLGTFEEVSGLASANVTFQRKTGATHAATKLNFTWSSATNSCVDNQPVAATVEQPHTGCLKEDGTLILESWIAHNTAKGVWQATGATLVDVAENSRVLTLAGLAERSLNKTFEQTGGSSGGGDPVDPVDPVDPGDTSGDHTSPTATKASVSPLDIDTKQDGKPVTLVVEVSEGGSGLAKIDVTFSKVLASGHGTPTFRAAWKAAMTSCVDGAPEVPTASHRTTACLVKRVGAKYTVAISWWIPKGTASGNYQITRLEVSDVAGNKRTWGFPALEPKKLAKRFKVKA